MIGNRNILIVSLCLVFAIDAATGESRVNDLRMTGSYGGSYCNADVTCDVYSTDFYALILWTCVGGPAGISNLEKIPGFHLKSIVSLGNYKYQQTLKISKCYSRLVLTCSVGTSSRSITLTSDAGLTVGAIVGIIFSVIIFAGIIFGIIGLVRRKRTQGVIVRSGYANPTVIASPPLGAYPTQPQPAVYPVQHGMHQQPPPPPYYESK